MAKGCQFASKRGVGIIKLVRPVGPNKAAAIRVAALFVSSEKLKDDLIEVLRVFHLETVRGRREHRSLYIR